MYSPKWGRFMSADPVGADVGTPMSWNRYAYVGNDPINVADPLGLCSVTWTVYKDGKFIVNCWEPLPDTFGDPGGLQPVRDIPGGARDGGGNSPTTPVVASVRGPLN
jgi:hypothetical protein